MPGPDDTAVSGFLELQLVGECAVGVLPPVRRDRRALGRDPGMGDRAEPRVAPQPLATRHVWRTPVFDLGRAELEEGRVEILGERDVETIDPCHG